MKATFVKFQQGGQSFGVSTGPKVMLGCSSHNASQRGILGWNFSANYMQNGKFWSYKNSENLYLSALQNV